MFYLLLYYCIYFCAYLCMFACMCKVMGVGIKGGHQIQVFRLGRMHLYPHSPLSTPLVSSFLIIIPLVVGWFVELLDYLSHSLKIPCFCLYHSCVQCLRTLDSKNFYFYTLRWRNKKNLLNSGEKPSYLQLCLIWLIEWTNQQKDVTHVKLQCPLYNLKG